MHNLPLQQIKEAKKILHDEIIASIKRFTDNTGGIVPDLAFKTTSFNIEREVNILNVIELGISVSA